MGDPLQHVQPRDPLKIPAQTFNIFCDAAEDFLKRRRGIGGQAAGPGDLRQTGIVLVKNSSGAARERFDVLGIDGPLFSPTDAPDQFKNRVILDGVVPTADHAAKFAVLLEPAGEDAIAAGCVAGVCVAKLDVDIEAHEFADVDPASCAALKTAGAGGAQILWKEAGTGSVLGIVRIGPPTSTPRRCTAVAKGAIAAGAAGTVDNVAPIDGLPSPVANAEEEVSVTNVTAIAADDDGNMEILWDATNEVWRAYPLECPA